MAWDKALAGASLLALGMSSAARAQTTPGAPDQPLVAPAAPSKPQSSSANNAATSGAQLEDIVVTASRRETTLRDVPTAISAYGGERLAERQLVNLNDVATISPNIQIGRSEGPNANVAIRGIGSTQYAAGSDPGVAFHVDGVYFAQTGLTASTLLDIDRVEILRGPQGTLFGRNATGGAINILPNLPTRQLTYGLEGSYAVAPAQARSSGYVSGPLDANGAWRGRLSAQQTYNRGYTRNDTPGAPSRLDDQNNFSVRGQLQWLPTDSFDTRLLVEYQNQDDNGPAAFLVGTPTGVRPAILQGAQAGDPEARRQRANQGDEHQEAMTATLTSVWHVGDGDLKGIFSAQSSRARTDQDGDGTAVQYTDTQFRQRAHQYYGELLYSSDAKRRLTYVLGLNGFYGYLFQDITVPIAGFPMPVTQIGEVRTQSYAAFAHVEWRPIDALKLFGGLRYTDDKKRDAESNNFVGAVKQRARFDRVTYEVGGSFDLGPRVTVYAKYATGYKSGGFSAGSLQPAFNPETNSNIEVGLKGSYLDGRLQANLAVFHTKYSDLQVQQIVGVSDTISNAARATVDGVELETVAKITPRLRLEVSGAYLNARFDRFDTADSSRPTLGTLDLRGNLLPQAPHGTLSAGAYYDLPVTIPGKLVLGARFDWASRVYFNEFNLPIAAQGAAGKGYADLRYTSANARWSAGLYARNITNQAIRNNVTVVSAVLGSLALATLQPGREVGVSLGFHF